MDSGRGPLRRPTAYERNLSMAWSRLVRWLLASHHATRRTARPGRLQLERLEDRTVPSVSVLNNSGNGYTGLNFNQSGGFVPPDTCGAAGPSAYVETVNQTVAL